MKSSATSKHGLYRAYDEEDDADPDAPTRTGHPVEDVREEAVTQEDLPASAPIPRVAPSFFPPDPASHSIIPPGISGEYPAVRIETLLQKQRELQPLELHRPLDLQKSRSDHPPNTRFPPKPKLGNDGLFDFGWMLGLAFLSACTVFVWLWFVARWLVR